MLKIVLHKTSTTWSPSFNHIPFTSNIGMPVYIKKCIYILKTLM